MRIAVIGLGAAGVQSLSHFLCYLPLEWTVTSISDPSIPILSIAESTNPAFVANIQTGLRFDVVNDIDKVDGTHKYGTKYINWREHEFVNPTLGGSFGIQMDAKKFVEFAVPRLHETWGDRFIEIRGTVNNIINGDDYVTVTVDDENLYFHYVVDARGFPKNYDNYIMAENPVNHCLIWNTGPKVDSPFGPYYSGHIAMEHGWMFDLALLSKTSYGYLFNDEISSIDEVKEDFADWAGLPVDTMDLVDISFKPYYTEHIIEGRICKTGNRAMFFEPMIANTLFFCDMINRRFYDYIGGEKTEQRCNAELVGIIKDIEHMFAFHYMGGSMHDSKFWQYASEVSKRKVESFEKLKIIQPAIKQLNKDKMYSLEPGWVFPPRSLTNLDKNFGYGLFDPDSGL